MSVEENDSRDVSTRQDTTSELSFDALARGLGSGALSRRQAMRLLGGSLVGSALALIPGVAGAAPKGPQCKPLHDKCTTNVQCCSRFCDKNGKQCACPEGTEIACNNRCVPTCHNPANPCEVSLCDPATGNCVVNKLTGTPCEDGNPCTLVDTCNNGTCRPGTPVDCSAFDTQCKVGVCDQQTGTCAARNRQDGTSCNADNDACTVDDECQAGVCTPGQPRVCEQPADPCLVAVCDPTSGDCVTENAEDGTLCDDGDLCTVGDTCQNGTCRPGVVTTCPDTLNPCTVSVCNPDSGTCELQNQTGTCDDGNPCTENDRCQSGLCAGDLIAGCLRCNTAGDCPTTQCQTAACTGGVCVITNRPNTATCNDNNPCTTSDRCQNGVCTGTAVTCPSGEICCPAGSPGTIAGTCRRASGTGCNNNNQCCSNSCPGMGSGRTCT